MASRCGSFTPRTVPLQVQGEGGEQGEKEGGEEGSGITVWELYSADSAFAGTGGEKGRGEGRKGGDEMGRRV